jgi:hypothetical protein
MLRLLSALAGFVAAFAGVVAAAAVGVFLLAPQLLWDDYPEARAGLDYTLERGAQWAWREDPVIASAALGLVAQEDERLFTRTFRGGVIPVDARACARAVVRNLQAGRITQGCSSLPMQVAKLSIPESYRYQRTFSRKFLQIRLSLALAGSRPDDVVGAFLREQPCGSDIARGFEQCALLYFGRPASQLNAAEAMLLASAVQAPSRDLRDPEYARRRLAIVLNKLWEKGWVTREQAVALNQMALRQERLHPDLVRAGARGYDLDLVSALGEAVDAARANAVQKQGRDEDLLVVGAVFDEQGEVLAFSGGAPSWLKRSFEAGSWVKPFCAQSLLELPGAGARYLESTEIPIALPLRDRNLRAYHPRNAGAGLPERAVPMVYILKSVNTASLASVLYAGVYMPEQQLEAWLSGALTPAERARYRTATDLALSTQLASAYAGFPLTAEELPGLPGYREISVAGVRSCLGVMRRHVDNLEVPREDLAALLGVVRAPLEDLGAGMTDLWLDGGQPTEIALTMRRYSGIGTLAWLTTHLGPLTYKTATAERNAGLMVLLPATDAEGRPRHLVLMLAAVRPGGEAITPIQGGTLSPGVLAFTRRLSGDPGLAESK